MNNTNTEQKPLELVDFSNISTLYANIDNNELHLSPNIKFKHLGSGWDAIQFMCSWQRKNQRVSIILNNQVNIEKLNFYDEVLLIAFYLAEKVMYKNKNCKKKLLKKFLPFVENMNNPNLNKCLKLIRAREIKFLCLEGAKNEFLKLFYNSDKSLKSKMDIENLVGNIFSIPQSPIKTEEYTSNLDAIKEIIYEAFSNAGTHGYHDIHQHVIPKNIRALSINFTSFSAIDKPSFIKHQKHYQDFLHKVKNVLVISIFDSGEGIVKKYIETIGTENESGMSFDKRKEILQKVFLPGVTSSQAPNSGMGLTYIKDRIKELKGLLSIRTNSLELFFTPTQNEEYKDHIKEVPPCVGTLITVLIPIGFNDDNV